MDSQPVPRSNQITQCSTFPSIQILRMQLESQKKKTQEFDDLFQKERNNYNNLLFVVRDLAARMLDQQKEIEDLKKTVAAHRYTKRVPDDEMPQEGIFIDTRED